MRSGVRPLIGAALLFILLGSGHFMSTSVDAPHDKIALAQITPDTTTQTPVTPSVPITTPTSLPTGVTPVPATPTRLPIEQPAATATPISKPPPPLSQRFETRPDDIVTLVTPGVYHIRRITDDPLRINLLIFDLTAPQFDIRVALGDGWLSGRARTSNLVEQYHALAGVNGDLFADGGIPQGMTMIDSRVAMPPKYRATFAWSKQREPFIGYFTRNWTWDSAVIAPDGQSQPLYRLNWPCEYDQICLYNEFVRSVAARTGDVKVLLSPTGRVIRIVEERLLRVPSGMLVLQGTGNGAEWLLNNLELDDQVTVRTQTDPPLEEFSHAISGGPIMLQNGRFVQDCFCTIDDCSLVEETGLLCEDFSYDWKDSHYRWVQMPRTGVGYDKQKQTLIVAVVDGYQLGYSRGITQREFADLFQEFGADTAMELDGGGSSTMVLRDQILNNPSDDTGERFVANALLFYWNETTTQPEYTSLQPLPFLQPK